MTANPSPEIDIVSCSGFEILGECFVVAKGKYFYK